MLLASFLSHAPCVCWKEHARDQANATILKALVSWGDETGKSGDVGARFQALLGGVHMLKESSQREALPKQHPIQKTLSPILTRPLVAFLASFPPRECGIATFTADLADAIDSASPLAPPSQVIAINPGGRQYAYGPRVCWTIERDELETY